MAQLRDAQTSEWLAAGTPLQMALLAQKVGEDEVIFDDVGGDFDPEAVIEAHALRTEHLEGEHLKVAQAEAKLPRNAAKNATDAMRTARARLKD